MGLRPIVLCLLGVGALLVTGGLGGIFGGLTNELAGKPSLSIIVNPIQTSEFRVLGDWRTESMRRDVEKVLAKQGADIIGFYENSYHRPGTYRVIVDAKIQVIHSLGEDEEQLDITIKIWYKRFDSNQVDELYDIFGSWRGGKLTAQRAWGFILKNELQKIYNDAILSHWGGQTKPLGRRAGAALQWGLLDDRQ